MIDRKSVEGHLPSELKQYDVIVVGGGPAGIGAALGAATNGAKTLLLESRGFLGGVGSLALWMPVNRIRKDGGSRGGVHDLFYEKLLSMGADASRPGRTNHIDGDGLNIHPEYLRLALYELLEEAGCHYQLYSPVVDTIMEKDTVQGVIVQGKDGLRQYRAKITIDASGDGDVAFKAGVPFKEGREEDGVHMPVSLVFAICGCEEEAAYGLFESGRLNDFMNQFKRKDLYTMAAWYAFDRTTLPGVLSVNNGGAYGVGNLNGYDPGDLTIAERLGARIAVDFVRICHEHRLPGLENCRLMRCGAAIGVRDTRRFLGEYTQTLADAESGARFPDVIAKKYGAVDANQLYIGKMQSGFDYPYRSLVPQKAENLLLAGRCASASFLGHAAGKSMGNMMGLGQAAGVAAALCAGSGVTPRSIDPGLIQNRLRAMGVEL